jgi:hypothetical protein
MSCQQQKQHGENQQPREVRELFITLYSQSSLEEIDSLLNENTEIYSNQYLCDYRGYTPLHIACIMGNFELIQHLVKYYLQHNNSMIDIRIVDRNNFTAISYVCNEDFGDALQFLLFDILQLPGIDREQQIQINLEALTIQTNDTASYIGGFGSLALYTSGGKTTMHYCAESESSECAGLIVKFLEEYDPSYETCKKLFMRDFDGNTPLDLAILNNRSTEACEWLFNIQKQFYPDLHAIHYLEQEQRNEIKRSITKAQEQRVKQRDQQAAKVKSDDILSQYTKKHPDLYQLCDAFFAPSFLKAIRSKDPEQIRQILKEEAPGIYSFDMMDVNRYCHRLIEEMENYEQSGFPVTRPNSMNNYGLILTDLMGSAISDLMKQYVEPISRIVFPDQDTTGFQSHHSFIVKYKIGEDLDLDEHVDSSDVTINLSLGKEFTGGEVYFRGIKGASDEKTSYFEYPSVPGRAIIHLGRHVHGSKELKSGTRANLIIWCRNYIK